MAGSRWRLLIAVAALTATTTAGAAALLWRQTVVPGPLAADATVIIRKGASAPEIAGQLASAGIIDNAGLFRLATWIGDDDRPLRAGEYAFSPKMSVVEVIGLLRSGRVVVRKLTVPEGLTTVQVLDLVRATDGLEGDIAGPIDEGALLPATYPYQYGDSRQSMVDQMTAAMRRAVQGLWAKRYPDLPLKSPEDAVTLASIVEKETAVAEERPRIAAVFINRLRVGMRLQADPTVAYGAGAQAGPLGRALTRADLATPSPYNTYLNEGLPPGPIANPGRAALAAVLRPLQTEEVFFVADGSGGHAFARTYEEHARNVERWRAIKKDAAVRDGSDEAK